VILALLGCVPLREGDWAVDYSEVDADSCGIYAGGQALDDTTGELSWDGSVLVFELDGTDDDLEFVFSGAAFSRYAEGAQALDAECSLASEEEMVGQVVSDAEFSGTTTWIGTLSGSCSVYDALFDPPCTVAFDWRGTFRE
jgi:hypothetical protein